MIETIPDETNPSATACRTTTNRHSSTTMAVLRWNLYGYLDKDAAAEAEALLDSLEASYSLRFNRSGLVFDFEKPGTEAPESEVGIGFHRIGFDLIRILIEGAAPGSSSSIDGGSEDDGAPTPSAPAAPIPPVSGLPKLQSAAFLVADPPPLGF